MHWLVVLFLVNLLMCISTDGKAEATLYPETLASSKYQNGNGHHRSRRSLLNFHGVIQCLQPWTHVLAVYGDYGCYCGYRGHGRPLDDTDKCCYYHDRCYDEAGMEAKSFSEWSMGSYFTSYNFECTENGTVVCNGDLNNDYQHALCECDRKAAECFLENRRTYSAHLYDINVEKYCKEQATFEDFQLNTHTLSKLYTCGLKPDQDKCCVDRGYNSAYQTCCNGHVKPFPSSFHENFQCCDNRLYDTSKQMCCYGTLHPNFPQFKCCGTLGAIVDTSIANCIENKVVVLLKSNVTQTTTLPAPPLANPSKACGQEANDES